MSTYKGPCQPNCENRAPGCHGRCENYKTWRAEMDAARDKRIKQRAIEEGLNNFQADGITRMKREERRNRGYRHYK